MRIILSIVIFIEIVFCCTVFSSSEEENKGIEVLNKFNSIKNYVREEKVFKDDNLQVSVKTKFFYPAYIKEEITVFPDSENPISRVMISNGKDLWFCQLSSHRILRTDIDISPDSKFDMIKYYVSHPLSISYQGEDVIDSKKVVVVKIIGFNKKRNMIETYFMSFEKETGLLRQIETTSDKEWSDYNRFEIAFGNARVSSRPAVKTRRFFYNYKLNNELKLEEFNFSAPKNFKLVSKRSNHLIKNKSKKESFSKEKKLEDLRIFTEAIKVEPKEISLYFGRASIYEELGDLLKAVNDCKKIVELEPTNWKAVFNIAYYFEKMGNDDVAMVEYTKAIQLNPNAVNAYINRALIYDKRNKFELALQDLNKAIDVEPRNPYSYTVRAFVYHDLKDYDKALHDVKKVEQLGGSVDMDFINQLTASTLIKPEE